MKKIIFVFLIPIIGISNFNCKKFLNIDPPSGLSGNNFWKTQKDIDTYLNGTYQLLRQSVTRPDLTSSPGNGNFPFFIFSGDFRGAPIRIAATVWGRTYIDQMAHNNILSITSDTYWSNIWNMYRFGQWNRFFKVIASANIAFKEIDRVDDPNLSETRKNAFKAEAVFLRCFTYFLMARQWGDVPYYTEAYFSDELERKPLVEVLKNCVADMEAVYDNLPWTYDDPVFVAVRAMKGSAIALLMHLNMWLAGFDEANKNTYYQKVSELGSKLRLENNDAYELLPLERTGEIFKGRSKEGLFEILQNKNYNESFGWSSYFDHVKYTEGSSSYPYMAYDPNFMREIYPEDVADMRKQVWYKEGGLYSGDVRFRMDKFYVSIDQDAVDKYSFDASQTVFRYSDAILLEAEALAELSDDAAALEVVNLVRSRASATPLIETGEKLKEQIFYERCRELMGEAHYWFDVVRTKRIMNNDYKHGYHCSAQQFKDGCWTWYIDRSVLAKSPKMKLNDFWIR